MTEPESKPDAPEPSTWRRGEVLPSNVGEGARAATVEPTWRAVQSPWLVAALVFASLNLYIFWWFWRTWSQIRREDGDAGKRPVWHALSLIVPIYQFFRFHAHMRAIVSIATTPDARAVISPLAMTVAWTLVSLVSAVALLRPQTPVWVTLLVGVLSAALLGWAQYGLNAAWLSLPGGTTRARVHPLHWLVLGLGVMFYTLAALVGLAEFATPTE